MTYFSQETFEELFPEVSPELIQSYLAAVRRFTEEGTPETFEAMKQARKLLGHYPYPIPPEDRRSPDDLE